MRPRTQSAAGSEQPITSIRFNSRHIILRVFVMAFVLCVGFCYVHDQSAQACGFDPPPNYLETPGNVFQMPRPSFWHEVATFITVREETPKEWNPDYPERGYYFRNRESALWRHTIDADEHDLALAGGMANVAAYSAMRKAMRPNLAPVTNDQRWQPQENVVTPPPFDLAPYADLLQALPAEFSLYVRGAAAYHAKNLATAIELWNAVLNLPENERHYRSVWAEYMLGRAAMQIDPKQAIDHFERVRALAEAGFVDSLDLYTESLMWQSAVEMQLGDAVAAIHRYKRLLEQRNEIAAGSVVSIICKSLDNKEICSAFAKDEFCRNLVTAALVSRSTPSYYGQAKPDTAVKNWLDALQNEGIQNPLPGADKLAWGAYRQADFEVAKQCAELADPQSPYAQWVIAKLLLREGNIEAAQNLYSKLAMTFPSEDTWKLAHDYAPHPRSIVNTELGVILTARGSYASALDAFLRAAHWREAAHIAERVMTTDELEAYLATFEEPELGAVYMSSYRESPDGIIEPFGTLGYQDSRAVRKMNTYEQFLSYLLARRYARNGDWVRALPLYPEPLRPNAEEIAKHLNAQPSVKSPHGAIVALGNLMSRTWGDSQVEVRVRTVDEDLAQHYYDAAKLIREYGMELLGTELFPDYRVYGGEYGSYEKTAEYPRSKRVYFGSSEPNLSKVTIDALLPSPGEKQRIRASAPKPHLRFHYRYTAANLMWKCAALRPDNDLLSMQALYMGGSYIKDRDPQFADKFYKALVWRNWETTYARKANEVRWFPKDPPGESDNDAAVSGN